MVQPSVCIALGSRIMNRGRKYRPLPHLGETLKMTERVPNLIEAVFRSELMPVRDSIPYNISMPSSISCSRKDK